MIDKTQYGIYHVAADPDNFEVARDNCFEFIVTDIDNILKPGMDETDENAYMTNAQNTLKYSVVSAPIPNYTQNVLQTSRGNSVMKFAGRPTFSDGSLVINDYIGVDSKSALMGWQRLSYDPVTDTVGKMSEYKKTCYLIEYTPDFSKVVRTYKMIGCWVSGISESDYNAEQDNKKTITATITYDRAILEY